MRPPEAAIESMRASENGAPGSTRPANVAIRDDRPDATQISNPACKELESLQRRLRPGESRCSGLLSTLAALCGQRFQTQEAAVQQHHPPKWKGARGSSA